MKRSPVPGIFMLLSFLLSVGASLPPQLLGQEVDPVVKKAYFRAVSEYFEVSAEEVAIVGDSDLEPDEVPVVLFLADKAGVSPDVLIGLRNRGRPWREVALQFGLRAGTFHLPMPDDAPLGLLSRAYGEFRTRSARNWSQVELDDLEIVSLVNIRVLSEQIGVDPVRVLQSQERAGTFAAGFASLLGRRSPTQSGS